jgi:hypothetical protein
MLLALTVPTLSLIACVGSLMLVNVLPYGDRTLWWGRALVFQALMLPALWISPTLWWVGVLFGLFLLAWFWLSRRINAITHKTFEFFCGGFQAVTLILAVQAHG